MTGYAEPVPLLGQAGAPVGGLREDPARLARLGVWMQRAFPALAAPMIEQGFWPTTRGGGWAGPGGPSARIRRVIRGSWMRWWGASRTTWR